MATTNNMHEIKRERAGKGLAVPIIALFLTLVAGGLVLSALILLYSDAEGWNYLVRTLGLNGETAGYIFIGILVLLPILLFILYKLNNSKAMFQSPANIKLQRWSFGLLIVALIYCYLEAEIWYYMAGGLADDLGGSGSGVLFLSHLLLLPVLVIFMVVVNGKRRHTVTILKKRIQAQAAVIAQKNREERRRKEEEEQKKGEQVEVPRFGMLSEIDASPRRTGSGSFDEEITLRGLCEEFRNFAANKLGLYYDIADIRRFIAGMAVSKILILQGMSGTGKTSLAYAFGQFLDNPSTVIPVQPMWKERTDLLGYYNEFTKRFNETLLLQKIYEANYNRDIYITILDEMNIARVEYYFAEFLSLLEIPDPEARMLEVVTDQWRTDPKLLREGRIKLPENMWFIGTANNDDSTFAISDKVYDRAMVLNLDKKSEPFRAPSGRNVHISAAQFERLAKESREGYEITSRNLRRIGRLDAYLVEKFNITFGNRIMKQIQSYVPVFADCGGDELDALDDIITKKVLRKLETQNAVYVRSMSEELCDFLDELFGTDRMASCKEYIRRVARNA